MALHAYIVVEDRNPDITLVRIVQYDLTQVNADRFRADINSDSKPDIIKNAYK